MKFFRFFYDSIHWRLWRAALSSHAATRKRIQSLRDELLCGGQKDLANRLTNILNSRD